MALGALCLAGCVDTADPTADRYHHGELAIGTGNTTGVFYEIGAGYADVISEGLPGYQAVAAPTAGSVDNLRRLASGDLDVGLVLADNAADAIHGTGPFAGAPVPIRAIARIYNNDLHVIVRTGAGIKSFGELRGHRVSTGAKGSGTESMADRLLTVGGIDPVKDLTALPMSLTETTAALAAGTIDAMFWTGGLPTPGITDLFSKAGAQVRFLPVDGLLPALEKAYGTGVYTRTVIPAATYGLDGDTATIAEPNLIVVSASLPDELTYQLTRLLFDHLADLTKIHQAAAEISRVNAPNTDPVPLASGAARYYRTG